MGHVIYEDCYIELCDENKIGKDFTFEIKFKTTGRSFVLAAENFKTLERWVSLLTISPIDYINISKYSFAEQIEQFHTKNGLQNNDAVNDDFIMIGPSKKLKMSSLTVTTNNRVPGEDAETSNEDIIDEALSYFKPNIFFREFEIKGPSDRTLIYLTFYITECLRKLARSPNKIAGQKDLAALALSHQLPIPGESAFPLNSHYKAPTKSEEETMRAYLQQLRQELGARLCEIAFTDPQQVASKWWLCFRKKRFMDKGLVSQGITL